MDGYSYVHSPAKDTCHYVTLPWILDKTAKEEPQKPFHIFRYPLSGDKKPELGRACVTFGEIATNSLNIASYLLDVGIQKGDHLAMLGSNCPEYLYVDYACLRLGVLMIRLPANIMYPELFKDVIRSYRITGMILDPGLVSPELAKTIPALLSGDMSSMETLGLGSVKHLLYLNKQNAPKTAKAIPDILNFVGDTTQVQNIQDSLNPDDTAVIFPTSGSTGSPKYVAHSHFSFAHNVFALKSLMPEEDTIVFNDRPFSWIGGSPYFALVTRFPTVVTPFDVNFREDRISILFQVWEEDAVTNAGCLPFLLHDMMNTIKRDKMTLPSSLRVIGSGGDQLPAVLIEFFSQSSKILSFSYGSTECGICMSSFLPPNTPTEKAELLTMFKPHSGYEIKVTNEDNMIVPPGQIGYLHIRSPFTMKGYFKKPELTDQIKPLSGWVDTGDLGIVTEEGYVKVVGRTKDVISKGPFKIYPKTVEQMISKHPKVEKVVVVGIPDPKFTNEICASVIPKKDQELSQEELKSFCETQVVGPDSTILPKYYYFVKQFPSGITGKIDRNAISSQAVEYFKLK